MIRRILPHLAWVLVAGGCSDLRAESPQPQASEVSPTRGEVVLNGLWRFLPANATEDAGPPSANPADWGEIWVPGDWRPAYNWPRAGALPTVTSMGPTNFDSLLERGVYARQITVPASWAGSAIYLDFQRLSTDATVWVDGQKAGAVGFPGGEVDVTALAKPGATQELRVQVVADGSGQEKTFLEGTMGDAGAAAKKVEIPQRGLVGDVVLLSRPAGFRVASVFVRPSVADKSLGLDVAFAGPLPEKPFPLRVSALGPDGSVAKTFEATVEPSALAKPSDGPAVWSGSFPWDDARLWSPEDPFLYTLTLAAGEATVGGVLGWIAGLFGGGKTGEPADIFSQSFGFREFRVEGRKFVLNGSPVRLRPTTWKEKYQDLPSADFKWGEGSFHTRETMRAALLALKRIGFNTIEEWPEGPLNRDRVIFHDMLHGLCDEVGLFVIAELPSMVSLARDGSWNTPAKRAAWERDTVAWIARQRNHPSIIAWIHSPNFFGQNALTQGPHGLGHRATMDLDNLTYQKNSAMGHAANVFIKAADPTRPVTTHHGATVGDFLAVNTYLNFTPQQELEDWWADYASRADMPFLAIEYEFPISYSFQGARWLARNGGNGERFFTEWLAARLGESAYSDEPAYIRSGHREHWTGNPKAWTNTHTFLKKWDLWETNPSFRKMMEENIRRQMRALRTWGIDGGVIPWEMDRVLTHPDAKGKRVEFGPFEPGLRGPYRDSAPVAAMDGIPPDGAGPASPFAAALQPQMRPSLAWIAGGPDRFTRKDSRFHGGEDVAKQIALVNDHQKIEPYSVKVAWSGAADGNATFSGELAPGEIKFLPLSFPVPEVSSRSEGTIRMEATIGPDAHEDAFAFSVWPTSSPTSARPVMVIDPTGKSSAMLKSLGVAFTAWDPATALPPDVVLVIGENALRADPALLARLPGLAAAGASVLVSRQSPDWLRDGPEFRVAHVVGREAFPVDPLHPVLAGLKAEDLRDWRGESSLIEANPDYPAPDKFLDQSGEEPMHYRRSGTLGAVSSAPIEKPHLSGWRPILQMGFDLAYSPLMELVLGKGRIVWSSLDLEDNVPLDPAATTLARNLRAWLATAPAITPAPTFLAASEEWTRRLTELGVTFSPLPASPIPVSALILLDPMQPVPANVPPFLEGGGTVVVLPFAEDPEAPPVMPFGASVTREMQFEGARSVPSWLLAAGLSVSDLRYRTDFRTWLVSDGCEVGADGLLGLKEVGKGRVVYVMINPWRINTEKVPALRTTRWRLTRAFDQVLANAGATFSADAAAFDPTLRNRLWLRDGWRGHLTGRIESAGKSSADPGVSPDAKAAAAPGFDDSAWQELLLPAAYHHPGWWEYFGGEWRNADGEAVFRRTVDIPSAWAGKDITLSLGRIADNDTVFFNGEEIGSTKGRNKVRTYTVPARLIKTGPNTLAVRVFNTTGRGGILGNPGSDFPGENSNVIDDALWIAPDDTAPGRFLGLYHPDYRNDHGWGDDPYRYWKW